MIDFKDISYLVIFLVGVVVVTVLMYKALSPKAVATEGENVDLKFIGLVLALIIFAAITIAFMLIVGKIDNIPGGLPALFS